MQQILILALAVSASGYLWHFKMKILEKSKYDGNNNLIQPIAPDHEPKLWTIFANCIAHGIAAQPEILIITVKRHYTYTAINKL